MHIVSSYGICQGMSWQHLNQPWGWIGAILFSLSLSQAGAGPPPRHTLGDGSSDSGRGRETSPTVSSGRSFTPSHLGDLIILHILLHSAPMWDMVTSVPASLAGNMVAPTHESYDPNYMHMRFIAGDKVDATSCVSGC